MGCIPSKKEVAPERKSLRRSTKTRKSVKNVPPAESALTEDADLEIMCEEGNFELPDVSELSEHRKKQIQRRLAREMSSQGQDVSRYESTCFTSKALQWVSRKCSNQNI